MANVRTFQPLFFATGTPFLQLARLVSGIEAPRDVDPVEFTGDAGGDATRELGVPFLAGMDEIDVTEASFYVNVSTDTDPRDAHFVATQEGNGNGVFVSLPSPGRLVKVAISYDAPKLPAAKVRVVVRPATAADGVFTPSPPIFADPPYPEPGPMFGLVLGGLTTTAIDGGGQMLTVPPTQGSAWLIQIATGKDEDGAGKMVPQGVIPKVTSVMVDALPVNFSVTLPANGGDVTLWSRPGLFLRGGAAQLVSFLPMARKHLSAQLKKATGSAALTVPLKFHSDSASRVEVTSKTLTATYRVKPFVKGPVKLRLGGSWLPVTLNAPAGLTSLGGTVDLTAKLLPRALNGASPAPSLQPAGEGLRVTTNVVATALPLAPLDGTPNGSVVMLASARVLIEVASDCEIVLEIRGDAAGVPGSVLAGPEVRKVPKGSKGAPDWLEFELKKPLPVSSGGAPVWVAIRLNQGELRWFADPSLANPTRVSTDKGQTWAETETPLGSLGAPWTQLFHALSDPLPAPEIRACYGDQVLANNLAAGGITKGKDLREFAAPGASLPAALLAALAKQSGIGRVDTVIHLFSRGVLDLTLNNASISYDPFGAGATKGS